MFKAQCPIKLKQTVLDGVPAGNTFLKVYVVQDLNYTDEDETWKNIGYVGEN